MMTTHLRRRAALATALLASACSDATAPRSDLLVVAANGRVVTLANRTSGAVSFLIATPRFLELGDPMPCTRPEGCSPSVPAGGVLTIPYGGIAGWEPGERTAVVIHWPGGAGARIDHTARRVTVRLR
jgi:hypothetical protein